MDRLQTQLVCALLLTLPSAVLAQEAELTGVVRFDVGSRSGIVEKVVITVGDGGTGPYKAMLAGDPALPTHTLYRPKDLSPFGSTTRLPIVAWANGGCRSTSGEFRNFLSEIASYGFLVVAIGPAAHSAVLGSEAPTGTSDSSQLIDGINWAVAENGRSGSEYFQKIDVTKVAVMGQSCGGVQALDVSKDPRVTTSLIWNSGVLAGSRGTGAGPGQPPAAAPGQPPAAPAAAAGRGGAPGGGMTGAMARMTRERLIELHAPIAYFIGGPSDIAYAPSATDFEQINHVPVLLANRDVGHYPATYRQPHGGAFAAAGVAWLQWQLKGDQQARLMFVGDDCGLCRDSAWTIKRKNLR